MQPPINQFDHKVQRVGEVVKDAARSKTIKTVVIVICSLVGAFVCCVGGIILIALLIPSIAIWQYVK